MKWPVKKWIKLISGFGFIWIVTQRTCSSGPISAIFARATLLLLPCGLFPERCVQS